MLISYDFDEIIASKIEKKIFFAFVQYGVLPRRKAANAYIGFVAIVLIFSKFLRDGLLTSYEVSRAYCSFFKNRHGKIIVSKDNLQIIYGKIFNSLFYLS